MYALLVILGAAITAAGIALTASAVSIQEQTFDPALLTPGAVAFVGGLILCGLGFVVRVLGRIEESLAVPPSMPRAVQVDEAAASVAVAETPPAPAIPFPSKPAAEGRPQPKVPDTVAPPAPVEDVPQERVKEKFPALVRIDTAQAVEDTEVTFVPAPPVRADEEVAEVSHVVAARQVNGAAPARTAPRLEVTTARVVSRPERARSFDAFWPKRQRPQPVAAPTPPVEPEAPPAHVEAIAVPTPVSILKSGVVDGMAYTLYSDGSIEAQLPQGLLRFGSITELRNHIEQSA
jgi:hypothetical protein